MTRLLRYIPGWCYPLVLFAVVAAANDFYTHGSFPSASSPATSASMRAELDLISAGFDKLPPLTGNGNKVVTVNAAGTGLTTSGALNLGGGLTISGNFATTLVAQAPVSLTLPALSGTLATLGGTETFTAKTFNLGANALTGTTAQFNAALSDDNFATLAGHETLQNKTLSAPAFSGVAAGSLTSLSLTTPIFGGLVTGTYTLAGTPTLTAPTLTAPTITGMGAGAMVLLSSIAIVNDPSVDLTTGFTSTYDLYQVVITDLIPSTDGADLWLRVTQDGGSTFKAGADYTYTLFNWNSSDVSTTAGTAGDTKILLDADLSNATTRSYEATVDVFSPAGTAKAKYFKWNTVHTSSVGGVLVGGNGGAVFFLNSAAINGLRLLMSSGNIASGTVSLYGRRKA